MAGGRGERERREREGMIEGGRGREERREDKRVRRRGKKGEGEQESRKEREGEGKATISLISRLSGGEPGTRLASYRLCHGSCHLVDIHT